MILPRRRPVTHSGVPAGIAPPYDESVTPAGIALEIAALGHSEQAPAEYLLHGLTTVVARLLPGCCAASISVWDAGRIERSSVSHIDLAALRDLPRQPSEDPERWALSRRQVVSIPDTLKSAEWPAFGVAAAAFGIRAVSFHPAEAGPVDVTFGCYATRPHAFDGCDLALAARQAGLVLRQAGVYEDLAGQAHAMRMAMASRSTIDQATGIIMGKLACTPERALEELRRLSNNENVKLADLARRLVSERSAH
jgi:hypothetical protein